MSQVWDGPERRTGHDHLIPVLLERVESMRGDLTETRETVRSLDKTLRGGNGSRDKGLVTQVELQGQRLDNIETTSRNSGARWGGGVAVVVTVVFETAARFFGVKGNGP